MITDSDAFCLSGACCHRASASSQARQGYLRLPDILLNSGRLRQEVIDDQSQLVIAGREVNREIKVEQGVDRFLRRPLARGPVVHRLPQEIIILVYDFILSIVEA